MLLMGNNVWDFSIQYFSMSVFSGQELLVICHWWIIKGYIGLIHYG